MSYERSLVPGASTVRSPLGTKANPSRATTQAILLDTVVVKFLKGNHKQQSSKSPHVRRGYFLDCTVVSIVVFYVETMTRSPTELVYHQTQHRSM